MKIDLRNAVHENLPTIIIIVSALHLVVNLIWFRLMYAKPETLEANLVDISVESNIFLVFLITVTIFDFGWLVFGILMATNREKTESTEKR